jgi:electron transport complex protein RnfB
VSHFRGAHLEVQWLSRRSAQVRPTTRRSVTQNGKIPAVDADETLTDRIDALLPQTQCTRCGYHACRPYAEAIAEGTADINRCPPGGPQTIVALAALTGRPVQPLDAACGTHGPPTIARIDEAVCIGCTLCIAACPIDAIIGGAKRMHAVLPSLCSGCALCVSPCPVDCIVIEPADREWTDRDAIAARERFVARNRRLSRSERVVNRVSADASPASVDVRLGRQARVAAAFVRARARRAAAKSESQ